MSDKTALSPVAQKTQTLKTALANAAGSIKAVAASHIGPERLMKIALGAASRTPLLLECSTASIVRAVVSCAELGLEPGPLGRAYLVPYFNKQKAQYECQFIPGYRGLIDLMYRSGNVKSLSAECVFEGDEFEYQLGTETYIRHKPSGETDPAKVTYAWCVITLKDGGLVQRVLNRKQLDAIRGRSPAGSKGPWVTDRVEMYRKTVIRSAAKYAPMSVEMVKAENAELHAEFGEPLTTFDWIDADASDVPEAEPTKGNAALKDKIATPEELELD